MKRARSALPLRLYGWPALSLCVLALSCAKGSSDSSAAPGTAADAAAGQGGAAGGAGTAGASGQEQLGGGAGEPSGGTGGDGGSGGSGASGGGTGGAGGVGGAADDAGIGGAGGVDADAGVPCGTVYCGAWKCVNSGLGMTTEVQGCCMEPEVCGAKSAPTATACWSIDAVEAFYSATCTAK